MSLTPLSAPPVPPHRSMHVSEEATRMDTRFPIRALLIGLFVFAVAASLAQIALTH